MSYYTVKFVREMLDGLPDDEPLFGSLSLRTGQEVEYRKDDGQVYARIPTPDEWVAIVDKAEKMADGDYGPWAGMWECLNDAKSEVVPYPEEEED